MMSAPKSKPPEGTILLIRHGIAADPRPGQTDADRPLTDEGWRKTRAAMRGLLQSGWVPAVAYSSPYRRAAETLVCLTEAIQNAGVEPLPTGTWEGLVPEAEPLAAEAWLLERLRTFKDNSTLAIVSHQPFLGELICRLTGENLEIRKASCTVIERKGGVWLLCKHFRPSELREQA
jgi:phosphohistidine phosphatase